MTCPTLADTLQLVRDGNLFQQSSSARNRFQMIILFS